MTTTLPFTTAVYSTTDSGELALDVFTPTTESRRCAVLVLHGGGWRFGAKEHVHDRAAALAAAGFTALAVQYRLLDTAPWPATLTDAAAALAWTRAHAEQLRIDPGRVVVQGHSAGAHTALMTGTLPADGRPAAITAYYPPIGFHPVPPPRPADPAGLPAIELDELGRIPSWMLFPAGADEAELVAASPITRVQAGFTPTILLHGTADSMVSPRSSIALHRRLDELGVPSELHLYTGRDHEFDRAPSMLPVTVATVSSFLQRTVTDIAESADEARRYAFPPSPQT